MELANKRGSLTPEKMQAVKGKLVQRKNYLGQELIEILEKEAGEGYPFIPL